MIDQNWSVVVLQVESALTTGVTISTGSGCNNSLIGVRILCVSKEEKEVIEYGSVVLLTETISNMLLRKRRVHGDVPLRVVGL